MTLPGMPNGWAHVDPRVRREEFGNMKVRLRRAPSDEAVRAELVDAYRDLGQSDQAGRFAIGLTEGATRIEIDSYACLIRGLRADHAKIRRLSILPPDAPLPQDLLHAIENGPTIARRQAVLWSWCVGAWMLCTVLFVIIVGSTYVSSLQAREDTVSIARYGTVIVGWTLVGTLGLTAFCWAREAAWRAAISWACAAAVAALCGTVLALGR